MTSSPYFTGSLTGTSSPSFFGEFIRLDLLQKGGKLKKNNNQNPPKNNESDGDTGEDKTTITHETVGRR